MGLLMYEAIEVAYAKGDWRQPCPKARSPVHDCTGELDGACDDAPDQCRSASPTMTHVTTDARVQPSEFATNLRHQKAGFNEQQLHVRSLYERCQYQRQFLPTQVKQDTTAGFGGSGISCDLRHLA